MFPIGGFVEFVEKQSALKRKIKKNQEILFQKARLHVRLFVIFGGIVFNIMLAYIAGLGMFLMNKGVVNLTLELHPKFAKEVIVKTQLFITDVKSETPQLKEVIKKYPVIKKVNQGDVISYTHLINLLDSIGPNQPVELTLADPSGTKTIKLTVRLNEQARIGIQVMEQKEVIWDYSSYPLFLRPVLYYYDMTQVMVDFLKQAINAVFHEHDTSLLELSIGGPISLIPVVTDAVSAQNPLLHLVSIVGMLSWSLALFNLIPFPGLDGWHILTLIVPVRKTGSRREKVINTLTKLGFLFLIVFAIIITLKDINLLFKLYGQ